MSKLQYSDLEPDTAAEVAAHKCYFEASSTWGVGRVVSPELAVLQKMEQDMDINSNSGVGYGSSITVFFRGRVKSQTWWWRDRFDSYKDRPELAVHNFSNVRIAGSAVVVTVQFKGGTRDVTFDFRR